MFYVKFWVKIYIPMGIQLVEQKQQQLLKFVLVAIFLLWYTISNSEITI